ncbi:MAG: 50S ribosomal protein L4 [Patescibacteria group bacterium]
MKIATYRKTGEKAGEMELSEKIFGVELNPDLVHRIMLLQQANRRQVSAHTKGRGDVSGGGKKPWAQKHTGRARHGSIRSPIWKGGGVSHGPTKERNFKRKISKTMRRKALCMVLSEKVKKDLVVLLEELKLEGGKTKALVQMLGKLPCDKKNILIILPEMDQELIRAGNNLSFAKTMQARELNVLDLLNAKYLVMPKDSLEVIEKTFAK